MKLASSGFCWKIGSDLAASASPSPLIRVACGSALASSFAAWRSASDRISLRFRFAFVLRSADEHLALRVHAVEHRLADAVRQAKCLMPRNSI